MRGEPDRGRGTLRAGRASRGLVRAALARLVLALRLAWRVGGCACRPAARRRSALRA